MSTARDFTSTVKEEWTVYVEETESRYLEDTAAVESGRCSLEDGLRDWYEMLKPLQFVLPFSFPLHFMSLL